MRKWLSLALITFLLTTPMAHAEDVWSMAQSPHYGRKAGGMFLRGLLNVVTSPVDLVVGTVTGTKEGPPLVGFMTGLGKGVGCTVVRALSGALDVVTFWVPYFNGYPPCKSYADCLNCAPQIPAERAYAPQQVYQPQQPAYEPPPAVVKQAAPAPQKDESPMRYIKK
ncbi:MAG: hypothetical protein COV74_08230 [Candidatus Omnitrophica bacterium CG11_big_fil_rev_8_21_14_0_20_45_26]|uniref:Exosortase system-associated protein, TIGR04073 family n=1 Tax=Candidatus Abzuiibacterium crystallinum TaxID=1974748 RepID=A0A2H0LM44_9BACT|nr:MAG: hypothetical protein COV74_08230 [Candidatus Omnitrophica bacterium CG11_big_fil_rev_8_21_14_0_20_45_26]PIW63648.1 MAG: hypothetical protein COW12_09115 [Candidatus Omnitrophica bacterium CG12_big_fil_rev_8_21_14_0_65_45_16]